VLSNNQILHLHDSIMNMISCVTLLDCLKMNDEEKCLIGLLFYPAGRRVMRRNKIWYHAFRSTVVRKAITVQRRVQLHVLHRLRRPSCFLPCS